MALSGIIPKLAFPVFKFVKLSFIKILEPMRNFFYFLIVATLITACNQEMDQINEEDTGIITGAETRLNIFEDVQMVRVRYAYTMSHIPHHKYVSSINGDGWCHYHGITSQELNKICAETKKLLPYDLQRALREENVWETGLEFALGFNKPYPVVHEAERMYLQFFSALRNNLRDYGMELTLPMVTYCDYTTVPTAPPTDPGYQNPPIHSDDPIYDSRPVKVSGDIYAFKVDDENYKYFLKMFYSNVVSLAANYPPSMEIEDLTRGERLLIEGYQSVDKYSLGDYRLHAVIPPGVVATKEEFMEAYKSFFVDRIEEARRQKNNAWINIGAALHGIIDIYFPAYKYKHGLDNPDFIVGLLHPDLAGDPYFLFQAMDFFTYRIVFTTRSPGEIYDEWIANCCGALFNYGN